jgi:UDP-glucose 4-epimerase
MKVFITGGAGFIGSHLAERLIQRGDQVSVLDDLSTGSMANIDHLLERPGFRYRVGSALDEPLVQELVERADITVHLAAAVGVRLVVEKPVHTIQTNVRASEIVLEAASRKNKPVLIASTSEVYGKGVKVPFNEEDDLTLGATTRSRWAYACSKALDEWLAFAYYREKGVPIIIVRFFNTVGPRQTGRYGMVLPNFARQALRGEPITVYGTGEQSRCFAHVRDVVEAVVRLLTTPSAVGEVFNIGSTEEVTIRELAQRVREAAGSISEIVQVPYDKAYAEGFEDMPRRIPDVSKLERFTGYRPQIPLEQIIADVVTDQRSRLPEPALSQLPPKSPTLHVNGGGERACVSAPSSEWSYVSAPNSGR